MYDFADALMRPTAHYKLRPAIALARAEAFELQATMPNLYITVVKYMNLLIFWVIRDAMCEHKKSSVADASICKFSSLALYTRCHVGQTAEYVRNGNYRSYQFLMVHEICSDAQGGYCIQFSSNFSDLSVNQPPFSSWLQGRLPRVRLGKRGY